MREAYFSRKSARPFEVDSTPYVSTLTCRSPGNGSNCPQCRSRTRKRCRARPRGWSRPHVNHSSHPGKAVQGAEILVDASLRKSELIDEPCIVKNPRLTVHVIRRTKSLIGRTILATGDTVKITGPSPTHSVAHMDGDGIRHKGEFVSFRTDSHVENLTPD